MNLDLDIVSSCVIQSVKLGLTIGFVVGIAGFGFDLVLNMLEGIINR